MTLCNCGAERERLAVDEESSRKLNVIWIFWAGGKYFLSLFLFSAEGSNKQKRKTKNKWNKVLTIKMSLN